jgi:hypothetical protein
MKQILAIILAVTALAVGVQAQQYSATEVYTSSTNSIGTNATVTNNVTITATKSSDVGLAITARGASGATNTVTASFSRSLDGTNWATFITLPVTMSGTNLVTAVTNVSVGAVGFLRLNTVANADVAATATNVSVRVSRKPGS